MKPGVLLILAVCAFSAGAFLAFHKSLNELSARLHQTRLDRGGAGGDRSSESPSAPAGVRIEPFVRMLSAMQIPQVLKQRHALCESIRDLETGEFGALIARAGLLPSQESAPLISALLQIWFERDPEQASAWVRAHSGSGFREAWLAWGRLAPESAIMEVRRNPGSIHARETFRAAVEKLAGAHPAPEAAKLVSLPADSVRDSLLQEVLEEWSALDASQAYAFARSLPPGPIAARSERYALQAWLDQEPEEALKMVMAILPEQRDSRIAAELVTMAAGKLAREDPQRALEWLQQLPESMRGSGAFTAVAKAWAGDEPVAALEWCIANGIDIARASKENRVPSIKSSVFVSRSFSGESDPNLHYPSSYFSDVATARATFSSVLEKAMEEDDSATLDWIRAQPDAAERARLLERALTVDSPLTELPLEEDRAKTIAELLATLPADARDQVTYEMAKNFESFEVAHAWATQLSDPISQAAAIEAAVKEHGSEWDDDVEAMLNQFPKGYQRDAALRGLAQYQSSDEGAETAMRIENPKTRHLVLDLIVTDWLDSDPEEAQAWISKRAPKLPRDWLSEWKR